ncbi:MAG: D-alanine--D-alanine ligase, partial [Clostridia bacterium]|nr:D-alanine--D-alanine ligase [Clostridia bacterium]
MKIVVLCGGLSPERNVSLSSGTKIAGALLSRGHKVVLVDMYFGLEDWQGELDEIFDNPPPLGGTGIDEVAPDMAKIRAARKFESRSQFGEKVLEVCQMADIVFLGLHGQCGEDGRVQAAFDLMGIKYTGSGYLGSAIAMDKDLTKRLVAPFGVLTPEWKIYDCAQMDIDAVAEATALPCVVKPVDNGSSIGVSIARTREELLDALRSSAVNDSRVVLERYVEGREIQIAILDGKALPSIEIRPRVGFYDYRNKYQPGAAEEITPSPIPAEAEELIAASALTVYETLGLKTYSRADYIYDN